MTPRKSKPTAAQLAVLKNSAAGSDLGAHLRTRSDYGGFTATIRTLYRRAWLDAHGITDAGRVALIQAQGSKAP